MEAEVVQGAVQRLGRVPFVENHYVQVNDYISDNTKSSSLSTVTKNRLRIYGEANIFHGFHFCCNNNSHIIASMDIRVL
jgi:acetyltransferase-like isoleucine patch superfamily enzyme